MSNSCNNKDNPQIQRGFAVGSCIAASGIHAYKQIDTHWQFDLLVSDGLPSLVNYSTTSRPIGKTSCQNFRPKSGGGTKIDAIRESCVELRMAQEVYEKKTPKHESEKHWKCKKNSPKKTKRSSKLIHCVITGLSSG